MTPAWPFAPEWSSPIVETMDWLTSVLVSRSGAEQRRALRLTPRRIIDYPVQLYEQERSYFDVFLMKNQGTTWYVPIPSEGVTVVYAPSQGDTFIPFSTAYRVNSFPVGGKIVVTDGTFNAEVAEVTSVTPLGVNISPLTKNYKLGVRVSPALLAQISDTVTMSRKGGAFYQGTVRFTAVQANPRPIAPQTGLMYAGYPVLTKAPNSVSDLDYQYERPVATIDNDTALPRYIDPRGFTTLTQKYDFYLVGLKERSDFIDLMYQLRGQLSPIWVPTFNDDLAPSQYWPDPDNVLSNVALRNEALEFHRNGTFTIRTAESRFGLPGSLFQGTEDIYSTSFLSLKRLSVDSIELSNYSNGEGVATVSLLFKDAPDLRVPESYYKNPFDNSQSGADALVQPTLDFFAPVTIGS